MPRVDVILDMELDSFLDDLNNENDNRKTRKGTEKTIKIDEKLFELALQEGLIEKTEDGYVFVGKYKDVLALKKNQNH